MLLAVTLEWQAAPNFVYVFIKFEEKNQNTPLFQPTHLLET
jgi:hypothetical protein